MKNVKTGGGQNEGALEKGPNYAKLSPIFSLLDTLDFIYPHNSYVIDYNRHEYFYISPGTLIFFKGYTIEEIKRKGHLIYREVLEQEDYELMVKMLRASYVLQAKLTLKERKSMCLSFDLKFKGRGGKSYCVRHSYAPYLFMPNENRIWLTFCSLQYSSRTESGNARLVVRNSNKSFCYNINTEIWEEAKYFDISGVELIVLRRNYEGVPDKLIADELCLSTHTVDYHKRQILKKLKCKSMTEAVLIMKANNLL